MTKNITCPVCHSNNNQGDICSNCETDLSVFRMLTELPTPELPKSKLSSYKTWFPLTLGVVCLFLGVSFGWFANYYWLDKPVTVVVNPTTNSPPPPTINSDCSRGFYYQVRPDDSLSLIALHFYGDVNNWQPILTANPQLIGRENLIEVGEVLLVPNIRKYGCEDY